MLFSGNLHILDYLIYYFIHLYFHSSSISPFSQSPPRGGAHHQEVAGRSAAGLCGSVLGPHPLHHQHQRGWQLQAGQGWPDGGGCDHQSCRHLGSNGGAGGEGSDQVHWRVELQQGSGGPSA